MTDPHARTRPNPRLARRPEGWPASIAVLASLLVLAGCVLLSAGVTFADRFPRSMDRYLPLATGQASLHRVTYADGSQGFLTSNVVRPSADSLTYATLLGDRGRAVQVHNTYTNWQGSGAAHTRDDHYARSRGRLLLVAQSSDGQPVYLDPPLQAWGPGVLAATEEQPLASRAMLGTAQLDYAVWNAGEEPVALPGNVERRALRLAARISIDGRVVSDSITWLVPGLGQVRYEERDGTGALIEAQELVNSSLLARVGPESAAWARTHLPLAEIVPAAPAAPAYYRESPARTGAYPGVRLAGDELAVTYRAQTGSAITAAPVVAGGVMYVADQAGQLAAIDAYQATPRWVFGAGGPIVAAPAVADGIVYFGAGDKVFYALDAASGLYLWSSPLLDAVAAAPVVVDGTVYVGGEDRALRALDARTGVERWSFVAGDRIVSSPAIRDGRLVFGADDGAIYALDAFTGDLLWRYAMDAAVEATPAIGDDGVVYVGSTGQTVVAIDAATGQERWTVKSRFGYLASPAVGLGRVIVADDGGTVRALEGATGRVLWEHNLDTPFASSPLIVGEHVILGDTDGLVHVWDSASGAEVQRLSLGDSLTAAPTWTGEAVLFATSGGSLVGLQAGAGIRQVALETRWQARVGSGNDIGADLMRADPLLVGDRVLLVLAGGGLWTVDERRESPRQVGDLGESVRGTPAVVASVMYVTADDGSALAYDTDTQRVLWQTDLGGLFRFGPAADLEHVFAHRVDTTGSTVVALNAGTGEVEWQVPAGDGNGTPVLVGDTLLVAGSSILALNADTGAEVWQSAPLASIGCLAVAGDVVVAGGEGEAGAILRAMDLATGKTVWERPADGHCEYASPVYDPATETVLVPTREGWLVALAAGSGDVRWRFRASDTLQSALHILDGIAYFNAFDGDLYAVEVASGRLRAHFNPGSPIDTYAGPLVLPNAIYAPHGTELYALTLEVR